LPALCVHGFSPFCVNCQHFFPCVHFRFRGPNRKTIIAETDHRNFFSTQLKPSPFSHFLPACVWLRSWVLFFVWPSFFSVRILPFAYGALRFNKTSKTAPFSPSPPWPRYPQNRLFVLKLFVARQYTCPPPTYLVSPFAFFLYPSFFSLGVATPAEKGIVFPFVPRFFFFFLRRARCALFFRDVLVPSFARNHQGCKGKGIFCIF